MYVFLEHRYCTEGMIFHSIYRLNRQLCNGCLGYYRSFLNYTCLSTEARFGHNSYYSYCINVKVCTKAWVTLWQRVLVKTPELLHC